MFNGPNLTMPTLLFNLFRPLQAVVVFACLLSCNSQSFAQSNIEIFVAGTTGEEQIRLLVNGQVQVTYTNLGTGANSGDFLTRVATTAETVSADQIRIEFINDLFNANTGADRNVRIDAIQIDGVRYETESAAVFSTGTFTPDGIEPGFGRGDFLHSNGYFQYAGNVVGESGNVTVTQSERNQWFTVLFDQGFQDPIVVMSPISFDGVSPIHTRVRNVTSTGFQFQFEEWAYLDGSHARASASWVAVERGVHVLADGAVIEADRGRMNHNVTDFDFSASFDSPPTVIGQTASEAGSHEVVHRLDNISSNGFDARLQEEEGRDGNHTLEDFHWIAFESGFFEAYATDSFFADENVATSPLLTGYDGVVLADMQTLNGRDTANLRITNQSNSSLSLFVEEEASRDEEVAHARETVAWVRTNSVITAVRDRLVAEQFASGFSQPVDIDFLPDGRIFVAEQGGRVRIVNAAGQITGTLLDIRDIVNFNADRGLLGFAVHPDFTNNGFIYAAYTYDPPEVNGRTGRGGPDGTGSRVARVSRFTVNNAGTFANPNTEVVLVGESSVFANIGNANIRPNATQPHSCIDASGNPIADCIAADETSHSVGGIQFGPDGNLYVASGDGGSFTRAELNNLRAQDPNSLNGKILRIDPITGNGIATNPFFTGSLTSNRSKVFALGLRNPFRFAITGGPVDPQLYIGDVGWRNFEEINFSTGGENFGWPGFEGGVGGVSFEEPTYQGLLEVRDFFGNNPDVTAPTFARAHAGGFDAVVVGDFASGRYGTHGGALIFSDVGDQQIRAARLDGSGEIDRVEVVSGGEGFIVQIESNPNDGYLYFTNVDNGTIGRIELE